MRPVQGSRRRPGSPLQTTKPRYRLGGSGRVEPDRAPIRKRWIAGQASTFELHHPQLLAADQLQQPDVNDSIDLVQVFPFELFSLQ
jgi:hypothetical protein